MAYSISSNGQLINIFGTSSCSLPTRKNQTFPSQYYSWKTILKYDCVKIDHCCYINALKFETDILKHTEKKKGILLMFTQYILLLIFFTTYIYIFFSIFINKCFKLSLAFTVFKTILIVKQKKICILLNLIINNSFS